MKKLEKFLRIIASIAMCVIMLRGPLYFISEFWPRFPDIVANALQIPGSENTLSTLCDCSIVVVLISYPLMRKLSKRNSTTNTP